MNVAVVGLGSIGRRHAKNLLRTGAVHVTAVRSSLSGNDLGVPEVTHLADAGADAAIVCTPTARHVEALRAASALGIAVLAEKPLVSRREHAATVADLFDGYRAPARVAFNMRFHPSVEIARSWVASGRIGPIRYGRFTVGQYLPDWHPGTDHLLGYSARAELGGGVALDLIHELDLSEWLCGHRVGGISGLMARVGDVTVDTEDVAEFVFRSASGAVVSVHLDYLFRGYRRAFELVGANGAIVVDLAAASAALLDHRGHTVAEEAAAGYDRNRMYERALEDFLSECRGENDAPTLPSFADSMTALTSVFLLKDSNEADPTLCPPAPGVG